ncbi:MAG TPA: hypothetical protein VJU86_20275 [Pyrinomonadaceae bacterium]|nr:hypothetical protein [Pyrinomonadaceae bacterium]
MKRIYLWFLVVSVASGVGCSAQSTGQKPSNEGQKMTDASPLPTPKQEPRPYSKELSELRVAFNRDKDKVRLVTLLSPT